MGAPVLYLYNLDNPKGSKIRRMCLPLGIRTKLVPPQAQTLRVGDMIEGVEASEDAGPAFTDEMLLIADFTSSQLDALLLGFRRAKIPPVALKAVLTPTNRDWTSEALHTELSREREAIAAGQKAVHPKV